MTESNDNYELMSGKDIEKLKKEITKLRKGKQGRGDGVTDSIENLNETITGLTEIFKEASMELKLSDNDPYAKKFNELNEQINSILEQNEKIAEAILTVADLAKEIKEAVEDIQSHEKKPENTRFPPQEMNNPFGAPEPMMPPGPDFGGPPPQQMGPPPFNPSGAPPPAPNAPQGIPPPPPSPQQQKRGMFGFK